jgi:F-type H+-transporting ATPase subunit delta
MAEFTTIARPYAEAVFKLGQESRKLQPWSEWLEEMAAVAGHPEMRDCINNPNLAAGALYDLFLSLLKSPLDDEGRNFLRVLIDNGRLGLLPEIRNQFEHLKDELEGTAEAFVVSAFDMSDAEVGQLTTLLETHFKRKIKPSVRVDKELIGGVRVTVGDEVLEASVRGRLAAMSAALQS